MRRYRILPRFDRVRIVTEMYAAYYLENVTESNRLSREVQIIFSRTTALYFCINPSSSEEFYDKIL